MMLRQARIPTPIAAAGVRRCRRCLLPPPSPWPPLRVCTLQPSTICKATAAPASSGGRGTNNKPRGGDSRRGGGGGTGAGGGDGQAAARRRGPWRSSNGGGDQPRQPRQQQRQQQQDTPDRPPTTARDEAVRQLLRIEEDGAYSGLVSGRAEAAAAPPPAAWRGSSGGSSSRVNDDGGGGNGSDDDDAWDGAAQLTTRAAAELDARDQRRVKELVAGVTRWRRRLDFVTAQLTGRGGERTAAPLKQVIRIGLYELLHLDAPAYVVSEHVELAKRWAAGGYGSGGGGDGGGGDGDSNEGGPSAAAKAAAGFANRVLRDAARAREAGTVPDPAALLAGSSARDAARRLAIEHSHPTWLATRWVARFGADGAAALMRANNARPTYSLRANAAVLCDSGGGGPSDSDGGSRPAARLMERLSALPGVRAAPSALLPAEFARVESGLQAVLRAGLVRDGACAVQDESTGLAVALLDPRPGESVLDLCAAPGNKTLLAATRMRVRGRVVAADVSARRLRALRAAAARQRLDSILETFAGDAADAVDEMLAQAAAAADAGGGGGSASSGGCFDKVLLDAPCSGTGVLAKRADLRWRREPGQLAKLANLQARLLAAAARAVRPGGLLVFSTCSIEPEEGRERVEAFLASPAGAGFALEPPPEGLVPADALAADGACVETLPHVHGVDGAFAARLRRAMEA